jgi:hypothetical protein
MIEEDLSWVDECVTRSINKLDLGYERCADKGEISTKFVPSSTYKDEEETLKAKQIPYPPNPKPSFTPKRAQKQASNQPTHPCLTLMVLTLACFVAMWVTWMNFAFGAREWRRDVWTILETHIVMSSLIFCLTFLLVLRLIFLMDLTITHMVLVHERVVLCLDAFVLTHALIMVFVPHVGMVFPLEVSIFTLSQIILMVHAFPIMVHVPLAQMARCIRLW